MLIKTQTSSISWYCRFTIYNSVQ